MTQKELAQNVLKNISDQSFSSRLCWYEGGACGGGYDTNEDVDFSGDELRFLIAQKPGCRTLVEGLNRKSVDVEARLLDAAEEACFPDGYITVLSSSCPNELDDLLEELDSLPEEAVEEAVELLGDVKDGTYTFYIEAQLMEEEYVGGGEAKVVLGRSLLIEGLLGAMENEELAESIAEEIGLEYDPDQAKDDIQDEIDSNGDCDIDIEGLSGESEELENYLEAMAQFVSMIADGEIPEADIDRCKKGFFDDMLWQDTPDFKEWYEEEFEG